MQYDFKKRYFEHSVKRLEEFIQFNMKKGIFNETQLQVLTGVVVNCIDQIYDTYKNCLGDAELLMEILYRSKFRKEDRDPNYNTYNWLQYNKSSNTLLAATSSLKEFVYNITCLSYGDWTYLLKIKLNIFQGGRITSKQEEESSVIVKELIKTAIDDVKSSYIYKERKKADSFF
ncbi:MAG: hypothetical protein EOP34_09575, partial [Rickettsiales bacterium]